MIDSMKALAEVAKIYDNPLREDSDIELVYNINQNTKTEIIGVIQDLEGLVEQKRGELGVLDTKPLNLPAEKAEELRKAIKSTAQWKEDFNRLVNILAPEFNSLSQEERENIIQVPWWNSVLLFRENEDYNSSKDSLKLYATLAHSYISQLMRSHKIANAKKDSMSVSSVLTTADGLIVLGWRGGHTYKNTIMSVPAGSVEYHTGKNPLFETIYAEHFEETGLTKEDLKSVELIGRVNDNAIANNSLYVFRSKTKMTFAELLKLWGSSMDRREHKYLIPLNDNPQNILEHIRQNGYDESKADKDKPSVTTEINVGSILPPCVGTLLLYCTQKEGLRFGLKAVELLNKKYGIIG
jgi:hypothetical protein